MRFLLNCLITVNLVRVILSSICSPMSLTCTFPISSIFLPPFCFLGHLQACLHIFSFCYIWNSLFFFLIFNKSTFQMLPFSKYQLFKFQQNCMENAICFQIYFLHPKSLLNFQELFCSMSFA